MGDLARAELAAREALAVSRAADDPAHEGEVLTEMAAQALARSDYPTAQSCVDRARELLRPLGAEEQLLLAELQAIQIPGADVTVARVMLDTVEQRFGLLERIHCRHLLWRATRDPALLPEAQRMIEFCREHAPPECRRSMIERVPEFAELLAAARK
jgi:hypothetical protein